jgi:2'-5' RNA ligase
MTTIPTTTPDAPGLYVLISIPLPADIADRLPDSRPGVRPHITLAGPCEITEDQARRILETLAGGPLVAEPIPVALRGVGDFRSDDPPCPVVFVQVASGADLLGALAAWIDTTFGLTRRFRYHPHVTLAWGDYELELAGGDPELDRVAAEHEGFAAACEVTNVQLQFGVGTVTTPRVIIWGPGTTYAIA